MAQFASPILTGAILLALTVASQAQSVPVPTPRPDNPSGGNREKATPDEPAQIYQAACPALLSGLVAGRTDAPIDESGCIARSPLLVTALGENGKYRLSRETRLNCRMATTLARLAATADSLATEILGSGLVEVDAGPGYQCRRRNRRAGGKLSEHAFANALDINGFTLADGRSVTVAADWPHPSRRAAGETGEGEARSAEGTAGRFLAKVHASACELFTTVLGPGSNATHFSHFHVDLGCHGSNCDYLICE